MAFCVIRRRFDVAVGADLRSGSLAREELLSMAIQARCMFGKLGNISKRCVAFTNFLPVFSGKLVTRTTREVFFGNVSGMRKARVINRRSDAAGLPASLAFSRGAGQSKNY